MSVGNKDYEKLMRMAGEVDEHQFMEFATKYMRNSETNRLGVVTERDGEAVEEIRVTRKLRKTDGGS